MFHTKRFLYIFLSFFRFSYIWCISKSGYTHAYMYYVCGTVPQCWQHLNPNAIASNATSIHRHYLIERLLKATLTLNINHTYTDVSFCYSHLCSWSCLFHHSPLGQNIRLYRKCCASMPFYYWNSVRWFAQPYALLNYVCNNEQIYVITKTKIRLCSSG